MKRIEVRIGIEGDALQAQFSIVGDLDGIVLPPTLPPKRQDELWRHTCCELFLRGSDSAEYYEFNFAPSTAWAAYRFADYRSGMTAAEVSGPEIATVARDDVLEVKAIVHLRECTGLKGDLRAAVSCVIEERTGKPSYWALVHPLAQPDFHHAGGFALTLSPRAHSAETVSL